MKILKLATIVGGILFFHTGAAMDCNQAEDRASRCKEITIALVATVIVPAEGAFDVNIKTVVEIEETPTAKKQKKNQVGVAPKAFEATARKPKKKSWWRCC